MPHNIEAIIWDFGGVITSSPFEAFNIYEAAHDLPRDFIRTINATNGYENAWAQFERNQIDADTFDALFADEARALGHNVPGRDVLACLAGTIRPDMVDALKRLKQHYKLGCITNNVKTGSGAGMARSAKKAAEVKAAMQHFDHIIESSEVGIRKPEPQIYLMACEALSVSPSHAVFLDDLGINLKPARALGMHTIKVLSAAQALADLSTILGHDV